MVNSVQAYCQWLGDTPLSMTIKTVGWLIPTVQTIHILSISVVMAAAAVVDLQVLGVLPRREPLAAVAQRFLPWIWWSVIVLLISGSTLIIAEPNRSLPNPAFVLKMSMLTAVLIFTLAFQQGLRRDARFWEKSPAHRIGGQILALFSLAFWVGIVFAGRWIAYIDLDAA
jgi:hypothetical protein